MVGVWNQSTFPVFEVDAADVVGREVGEVQVIVRVGIDPVDRAAAAVGQLIHGLEALVVARLDVEPENVVVAGAVRPDFPVHVVAHAEHVGLGRVIVPLRGQAVRFDRLGLSVELGEGALIHHARPHIAGLVFFDVEQALRIPGLELRHGIFLQSAGLGIEFAEEHFAEVGVPDHAVLVDDHVMRLDRGAREIVFGDDDVRGFARGARQRLQVVIPLGHRTQVDRREKFGLLAILLGISASICFHAPLGLDRLAHLGIAHHARDDLREFVGIMRGL